MSLYVLDACAVLAYLNNEPGAQRVESLFEQNDAFLFMSAVNVLEVCYDTVKHTGNVADAKHMFNTLAKWPITIVDVLDESTLLAAAAFKAKEKLSLADAIALGLAQVKNAKLVTADHHEFDILEQKQLAQFEWIR